MARIPQTVALGKIHIIQANVVMFYLEHPFLETATEEQVKELAEAHCGRYQNQATSTLWVNQQYVTESERCLQTVERSWGKTELPWFVPITQLTRYGNVGLYWIKAIFEDKFVWFTRLPACPMPRFFSRIKTETEEVRFIKVNDRKNKNKEDK